MSRPTFSVVIPTYNRPHLLERAVESVLQQTLRDFEVLVVDDASEQEVAAVVERHNDSRLHLVRRQTNGGPAAALNTGIRRARADLIAILGDDDEYLADFLEETRRAWGAASEDVGFSWCGVRLVEDTPDGERLQGEGVWQPSFASRAEAHRGFLRTRRIGTNCGVTVHKRCFDGVGLFDESLRKAEDTDFFIRAVAEYDFLVLPGVHVKVHHHPGPRATSYDRSYAEAYTRILDKNRPEIEADSTLSAVIHYKVGWLHHHAGDRREGRRHLFRSIRRRPLQWKAPLALALFSLAPAAGARLHLLASKLRRRWISRRRPGTSRSKPLSVRSFD